MTTPEPPVRDEALVFGQPEFDEEAIAEVADTIRSGWVGTGPKVARFEALVAEYVGCEHAVAVSSCSAALHLALLALGIGPGDEVITTPLTFVATVNAILHVGATPVLVDVDRVTQNIDPELVAAAVTDRNHGAAARPPRRAPVRLDALGKVAAEHGLMILEDGAHTLGGEYRGTKIGAISDVTAFSFYATKNVALGEGGIVATNRSDWATAVRSPASTGSRSRRGSGCRPRPDPFARDRARVQVQPDRPPRCARPVADPTHRRVARPPRGRVRGVRRRPRRAPRRDAGPGRTRHGPRPPPLPRAVRPRRRRPRPGPEPGGHSRPRASAPGCTTTRSTCSRTTRQAGPHAEPVPERPLDRRAHGLVAVEPAS